MHLVMQPNAPLHLPPTLARLPPKTRARAALGRARTRAEGGQVQAVVRWQFRYKFCQPTILYGAGYGNGCNGVLFSIGAG